MPISRGNSQVEPQSGTRPMRRNACRKYDERAHRIMSPINAKLMPAPAAGPLTEVTIGQCKLRSRRRNGWNAVSSAAPALLLPGFWLLRPCRLAPVQNARPAPVMTRQRTSALLVVDRVERLAETAQHVDRHRVHDLLVVELQDGHRSVEIERDVLELHCFLIGLWSALLVAVGRNLIFEAIFDFLGGLVHGWIGICPLGRTA